MSKLVLIGGGGHCRSVLDCIKRMDCFDEIVITDSSLEPGTKIMGCTVMGNDDCLEQLKRQGFDYAFVTVGSVKVNPIRERIADHVSSLGFIFPVIQDPSAVVSDSATIGGGTFIGKNAVINSCARIGEHCIINTGAIIEHDCIVESFTHVSVGATLCGKVKVGRNSMIGAKSTVIQCVNVGDNCVVGAGAVIIRDLVSDSTAVGVPARII